MAYATTNPPVKFTSGPLDDQLNLTIWSYKSTDAIATVLGAGYFSNGGQLGMTVGDIVFILDTTNTRTSMAMVAAVSASTGAVNLGTTATTTSAAGALTLS